MSPRTVGRLTGGLLMLGAVLLGATLVFLATWDKPAPTTTVEKVIPDERFPR